MMDFEQMPLLNEKKTTYTRRWLITPQPLILAIFGTFLVNCMCTDARSTPSDQDKSLLDAYSPDSLPLTPNSIPPFYTNYYQDNNYNSYVAAVPHL
uniref:Uncharacterized protein n=1 Tax=Ditylenchus dipsaci TaxID=166011 RepID=A0A915DLF3_9BILA